MKPFLLLIVFVTACQAEPHLPAGTQALLSAAPKGRGPLALVNLFLTAGIVLFFNLQPVVGT